MSSKLVHNPEEFPFFQHVMKLFSLQNINVVHVVFTAIITSLIICATTFPISPKESPCLIEEGYSFEDSYLRVVQIANQNYEDNMRNRRHRNRRSYDKCDEKNIGCTKFFKMLFLAPTWPCPKEVHVGGWGEGGKWLCNTTHAIPKDTAIVYSIGSRGDPQFESSMNYKFGVSSHTFDPTMTQERLNAVANLSFLEFHNIGLSGHDDPDEERKIFRGGLAEGSQFMRIDQIMDMLNHTYVDVFKIDCEGCEVLFTQQLKKVTNRKHPRFGQVLMEIHHAHNPSIEVPTLIALEELGYRLFHVEPNFFCPECYELAFIHETLTTS